MESPIQFLVMFLSSTVVSGVILKLIDMIRDGVQGATARRRSEVETAVTERDTARKAVSDLQAMIRTRDARIRILEESLHIHRRRIIENIGEHELPEWPNYPT